MYTIMLTFHMTLGAAYPSSYQIVMPAITFDYEDRCREYGKKIVLHHQYKGRKVTFECLVVP